MNWSQKEINECIESCRQKAMVDENFRKLLITDISAAVKIVTSKDIPAGVKIKVIEDDPSFNATFVLPPLVSSNISDDELDEIAGGRSTCVTKTCVADKSLK